MTDRVDRLVAELTLDEKVSLTAGATMWTTAAVPRLGIPSIMVTDGPNGAAGRRHVRADRRDRGVRAVRLGARCQLGPRARRAGRRDARRGGAHEGVPDVARADRQHAPLADRGPELRVLLRGSAPLGSHRRRLRPRGAVAGHRNHGEALRRERRRVRAQPHELDRRSSGAARDHPGAVRAGGEGRWRARDHDRVQPPERRTTARSTSSCSPTSSAASGDSKGSSSPTGTATVRPSAPPRPGSTSRCPDRRAGSALRSRQPCATARSTKRWSTTRCGGCSASSNASARSTTPRSVRARRSIAPTTARSPARRPRRRWSC